ncbi:hypothetical protein AAVH_37606, partial [Aphelenchoides avenae]
VFELGEIDSTVKHFMFESPPRIRMNCAFNRDNLVVSGMKVEGKSDRELTNWFVWDVYRFRNILTNEYLTACVGQHTSLTYDGSILHILKGEVYPDASFADIED